MSCIEFFVLLFFFNQIDALNTCAQRQFAGASSPACVCNATYCDEFPPLPQLNSNQAAIYTTSQSGNRYNLSIADFSSNASTDPNAIKILIDPSITYQSIIGFGGAFTGAATYNIYSLKDKAAQDNLINAYFGKAGNEYTLARVPIAASDFSLSVYSYDDTTDDFDLVNFALGDEDILYKIPTIQRALNVSTRKVKLFATPWSAPGWMKTNGKMAGGWSLKGNLSEENGDNRYFKAFANYHLKFFETFYQHNVSFWGVTIQNEPNIGTWYPSMIMSGGDQRDFVKTLYGPIIRNNSVTKDLKIMIWDASRVDSRDFVDNVLSDSGANKYVDGVGMHWYSGLGGDVLDNIHYDYPDKFILYTEASTSFIPNVNQSKIAVGNWADAYFYVRDILDDLNHWSCGWTDWNMVLNVTGEPRFNSTLNENRMYNAPIIVSSDGTEFYKQPAYYVMGHFSKFIVPNSTRIFMDLNQNVYGLQGVAFLTPENQIVSVFSNAENTDVNISLQLARPNQYLNVKLVANSVTTFVWSPFATQCPSDWIAGKTHPNKCYKIATGTQEPWFEAKYDCSKLGNSASLVSIDDAFENSEIFTNAGNNSCSQFYIGLFQNDNQWAWANGDPSSYRNWKAGYPTNDANQACGVFDKATGKWMNQDCDIPQCYICAMSLV